MHGQKGTVRLDIYIFFYFVLLFTLFLFLVFYTAHHLAFTHRYTHIIPSTWTAPLRGVGDQRHRDALDATSLRWRLSLSLRRDRIFKASRRRPPKGLVRVYFYT